MTFKMLKFENTDAIPEILIYFFIESLGDFLWSMKRAVEKFGANPTDLQTDNDNAYHDQQQLVELIKARPGFNFADHAEYMLWYRWWNNWHKRELTEEQWIELDKLIKWDGTQTEADFTNWRPKGNWKNVSESSCS
jgi:hypothetical protein